MGSVKNLEIIFGEMLEKCSEAELCECLEILIDILNKKKERGDKHAD